ncbi:hypothetical protein GCM10010226_85530 [Streptomyces phaeofaciens]|uniref:Uncharacterized protein n=1 Tax=Streptomyces phaeofaciens TaxID=68254 RepID=A0A918HQI2_9ACTN|nr:hypothetical protein GCM10010226_85530 [Streptomyces phaeofaciens]
MHFLGDPPGEGPGRGVAREEAGADVDTVFVGEGAEEAAQLVGGTGRFARQGTPPVYAETRHPPGCRVSVMPCAQWEWPWP